MSVLRHDNLNYLLEHDSDKEEWYLDDINDSATADETGGWYINQNCSLDFLYEHVSNPSLGIGTGENSDPCLSLEALTSLHVPLMSSLVTVKLVEDIKGTFFKVPIE